MAEIRVPKRQSFINRPVGVARTDAGEVQAAQQLANASRTLSNATFNTASQFMQAGVELQQDYEQRKFSEWAETVSMTNPDGSPGSHKMPKYLSGKTKDQVNSILQKRYAVDSSRRLDEHMVQARAKYANNPDEEVLFAQDVSVFIEETAQQIEKAGGLRSAQQFRDQATVTQSKHINNIRVLNSEKAENANAYKLEQQIQKKIGELQVKAGDAGELVTREDYLRLSAEIDEVTQISAISVRKQGELKDALRSSYALGILNNSGFLNLSREQRSILLSEIAIGGTPTRSMEFMPEIAALMAPGGILSEQQTRNAVASRLSFSDSQLSKAEVAQREQANLLNSLGGGQTGVKARQASQIAIAQQFNIDNPNDPVAFVQAYENNPEVANQITAYGVIPAVVRNTLDRYRNNIMSEDNVPLAISMARLAKDSLLSIDGINQGDLGLGAENLAFANALIAIDEAYPSNKDKFDVIRKLAGTEQDVDVINKKLSAAGYFEAKKDPSKTTPTLLAREAMLAQGIYNPEFVQKFAPIYASIVNATSVEDANKDIKDVYNTYYKEYAFGYVPDGGFKKQPYMPNFYYDAYGLGLYHFGRKVEEIVDRINVQSMDAVNLKLGTNTFLKPDPMNKRSYGRWVFVNAQGNPHRDSNNNIMTIDTNAIEAETILERRRRLRDEERVKAEARAQFRIDRAKEQEAYSQYYP